MKRILLFCLSAMLMLMIDEACAQQRTVTGLVTSVENGSPLPGVNVLVKGTTAGTVTDAQGNYSVSVPSDDAVLVFTFIGLQSQEVAVGGRSAIDLQMASDVTQLSEIVVVGYGAQSERNSVQAVSTIKSDALKNLPVISPQQLLQGQAAGVQMVNSSGVLGSASTVRIRGVSSIEGGSSPLYVVDGVPLNDGANGPLGDYSSRQGGSVGLNPLLDMNPNDIESISVLKDAAAVAIYGSRGSNGVILIKTKSGGLGEKTRVNLDYSTGWSRPTDVLNYMSPEEYKGFVNEWRTARGLAPTPFTDSGFDWVEGVVRTGRSHIYNVSVSGGTAKTKFFVGGGYHDESGFTIGNDLKRLSGRFNLNHEISKNIRFGINYALSNTESDRIGVENSTYAPLSSAYLQTPTVEPYDENGQFVNTGFVQNVLGLEALNLNKYYFRRQTGNISAEWDIVDNLRFRSEFGIDLVQAEEKYREADLFTPGGEASRFVRQDYKWLTTNTLNYDKVFGDHYFAALLGQSFETSEYEDIEVGGTGFVSDKLLNVGSASEKTTTDATATAWALESQFGRLSYRFKDRYMVEGTVRRDGSSRFGRNKKYGTFWAVSGGWIISDEAFLVGSEGINFLKLTASFGTSGNDRIGNFASLPLYSTGVLSDYAEAPGLIPSQVANPELSWEETEQFDVGLSIAVLNSRLSLDVNYYIKNTSGLLAEVPYPFTTGFSTAVKNVGEMRNTGLDLQINSINIQTTNFTWNTSFNIGFVKNEVLALPTNKDAEGRDFLAGSTAQRAIVGETLNTFYMIRYKGVNPQTGDAEWLTKNGEATSTPTAADRVVVGSAIPDFTGGLSNTLRYRGFDLNIFFNFSYGNKVLIDGLRFTENMGGTFNKNSDLLNYWRQPGDQAFAPRLNSPTAGASVFSQLSTLQLLDGSFMRLKTLSLGYNLPKGLLEKTKAVASCRVYVMGQNLWTLQDKDFRGPDPEVSANGGDNQVLGESFFALPQPKSIAVGVNLGF